MKIIAKTKKVGDKTYTHYYVEYNNSLIAIQPVVYTTTKGNKDYRNLKSLSLIAEKVEG